MNTWPYDWISKTLQAAGVPDTVEASRIMLAWRKSTPLPPLSNNPVGMPVNSSGAPSYMGTRYAIFPSMDAFYAAFGTFARSSAGQVLVRAMTSDPPYGRSWRAISSLSWPGSDTETDYPAILLDLTSAAYRRSVEAASADQRKTSGMVGIAHRGAASTVSQGAAVNTAVARIRATSSSQAARIRKGSLHGIDIQYRHSVSDRGAEQRGHGVRAGVECPVEGDLGTIKRRQWRLAGERGKPQCRVRERGAGCQGGAA